MSKVVSHGSLRIGFTHGHQLFPVGDPDILLMTARQMDCDILVYGHTHKFEAFELEGKFFINPGSLTGAFNALQNSPEQKPVPTFCLMDVEGVVLTLYVYQLVQDQVKVEKVTFRKAL